jgi:hypothetical protein
MWKKEDTAEGGPGGKERKHSNLLTQIEDASSSGAPQEEGKKR